MSARADLALGGAAVALAGFYAWHAASIEDSLLSDSVGAGGVPLGIAALVGAAGLVLAARALPTAARHTEAVPEWRAHLKAAGLVAILAAYLLLLPWLGYPTSILLLSVGVATYAGARLRLPLLAFGAGTALVLWGAFVLLLRVPFPAARLLGG